MTWAEDGYDLWLRYAPIESAPLRDAYRQAIAGVVVQQSPGTATIVSKELARGLRGLLGVEVPAWTSVTADGALVVGTAASPIVSALGWGDVLKNLGPEGFVIRHARVGGRRALVVASLGDRGALYGTFHLLRLLSTGASIAQLDVREKPRHQLRLLNHWDNLDGSIERGYAGALPLEVGGAARDDRSAAARLRACERVARPERHRSQQRERQRAVAHRRVHRQGRRHRRHAPALRPEGVPVRQLRRAAHDRRADHRRPARPGRAALVEGQGGRNLPRRYRTSAASW